MTIFLNVVHKEKVKHSRNYPRPPVHRAGTPGRPRKVPGRNPGRPFKCMGDVSNIAENMLVTSQKTC